MCSRKKKCSQKFVSVSKKSSNKSLKCAQTKNGPKKVQSSPFDVAPIKVLKKKSKKIPQSSVNPLKKKKKSKNTKIHLSEKKGKNKFANMCPTNPQNVPKHKKIKIKTGSHPLFSPLIRSFRILTPVF
jgi:hypothetical protein